MRALHRGGCRGDGGPGRDRHQLASTDDDELFSQGLSRKWAKIEEFVQEVSTARIYDGVHFRNSTEVGTALGKQVGALAVEKFLRRSD